MTAIHNVGVAFKDMAESRIILSLKNLTCTQSREVLNESLELRRIVCHQTMLIRLLVCPSGVVKNYLEKDDEAIEIMLESIEIFRAYGKEQIRCSCWMTAINNLGYMYKLRGNYDSRKYYLEALEGEKNILAKRTRTHLYNEQLVAAGKG